MYLKLIYIHYKLNILQEQCTVVLLFNFMFVLLIIFIPFSFNFSVDRASFPSDIATFVTNAESISTSGNSSKGECMDANLEEKNKESKVRQHGGMTALDWLRIFRNLGKLTSVSVSIMLLLVVVKRSLLLNELSC